MPDCVHCLAGHKPVWQAHSREWVHRNSWVISEAARTTGFSITICTVPPDPPTEPDRMAA